MVVKNTREEGCAWGAGALDGRLPVLKTLSALVEVYPDLGKLAVVGNRPGQHASADNTDKPTRTQSEEEEYQHQKSVQLMRNEQRQNEILVDTVKRIQGSSAGSLYANEIALIRDAIGQKHEFINKLHAEGIELEQKIEEWRLRLRDEEDRSKGERDRVLREAKTVETAIDDIKLDKQLALQRLGQYELLYTRTAEDRSSAESKMLRARELVSMGREDVLALQECLLQTKAAQERREKELTAVVQRLESSRATWKSSLEQRTREIDAIIRRYEEAKSDRMREEEAAARQRLEAERVRQEMEEKELERAERVSRELERSNTVRAEQWRVICAAAGVEETCSAGAVIEAYEACKQIAVRERPASRLSTDAAVVVDAPGTSEALTGRGGQEETPSLVPSVSFRAEMSLRLIRRTLAEHFGEEEGADDDRLVEQLQRLATKAPVGGGARSPWTIEEDRVKDLAKIVGSIDARSLVGGPQASSVAERHALPDTAFDSRVLSRTEVKARSRKLKAKMDKGIA